MNRREEHHGDAGSGPDVAVALDVTLTAGSVRVRGKEGRGVTVVVEADPDTGGAPGWGGVAGLLGRVEEQLTGATLDPGERARRAVEATTVTWDDEARELRVAAPGDRALRSVPLAVTVLAGEVGALRVRAGAAAVRGAIPVGEVDVEGTGTVDLLETRGRASVRCGAGDVRIGTARAALRVRGGAGEVAVERAHGPVEVVAGAGRVRLGEVHADVAVRLAGGDVTVDDAVGGDLDLSTGAGSVRVGVRPGVDARLDLHTAAGRARSELEVHADRPPRAVGDAPGDPVRLRARSTAGDVLVGTATPVS